MPKTDRMALKKQLKRLPNEISCAVGWARPKIKAIDRIKRDSKVLIFIGDPCFPDYTYTKLVAGLEESGQIWTQNIENNRKRWEKKAEEEKLEKKK